MNRCASEMEYKLMVVGGSQVGKTALINQFVSDVFMRDCDYTPTFDETYSKTVTVEGEACLMDIYDTSGDPIYYTLAEKEMRKCDGFMCLFAVDDLYSFEEVNGFIRRISLVKQNPPMVLVGTKCDSEDRKLDERDGKAKGDYHNIPYIETSAKQRFHVNKAFLTIIASIRHQNLLSIKEEDTTFQCCKIC